MCGRPDPDFLRGQLVSWRISAPCWDGAAIVGMATGRRPISSAVRMRAVAPEREGVDARVLQNRDRDRRQERQALQHQHAGEDVDLADLLGCW